jgi:hypothetical protein
MQHACRCAAQVSLLWLHVCKPYRLLLLFLLLFLLLLHQPALTLYLIQLKVPTVDSCLAAWTAAAATPAAAAAAGMTASVGKAMIHTVCSLTVCALMQEKPDHPSQPQTQG